MLRKARVHRSMALEADARHLFTDVWTSAGVVVGLLAVQATGWLWLDPVIAIAVALNILREGGRWSGGSADGLMDSALEPEVRAQIDQTLADFGHQTIRFDHVVTRRAGQRRFVDLHMHMPASLDAGPRGGGARQSVEQALMSAVPGLRATIQLLPLDVEAHFDDRRTRCDRAGAAGAPGAGEVAGQVVGAIGPGLLVLVCAEPADTEAQAAGWWTSCSSCASSATRPAR
jgi:divalent metal cation (Fe/Co/Zn/Cd) transporter